MIPYTIATFIILSLLLVIQTMARRQKVQKLEPQYLIAPAPKTKADSPLRLPFTLIMLAAAALAVIYLFGSYKIDLTYEQDAPGELELVEVDAPAQPPDDLSDFGYGP